LKLLVEMFPDFMGRVNHCRLAKFCGLMCGAGENTALRLVGKRIQYEFFQVMGYFKPITALYFPTYIKPRNFAKRQCERQWSTPPNLRFLWMGRSCERRWWEGLNFPRSYLGAINIKDKWNAYHPSTLTPLTQNPKPLHPKPYTLNPYTLNHTP
jgi:hypothetical protein